MGFDTLIRSAGSVVRSVDRVVDRGVDELKELTPDSVEGFAKDALSLTRDAGYEVRNRANTAYRGLKGLPHLFATWKLVAQAAKSGERTLLPGQMPPYPKLDPTQLQAAHAAGQGRSLPQGFLTSDAAGTKRHEPVNFIIRGSKSDLFHALRSQGWVQAVDSGVGNMIQVGLSVLFRAGKETEAPVSDQYLNGKLPDFAFNKNSDYNMGRDHMRVYHQGKDPATGEDIWAVASTRDTAISLNLKHPIKNDQRWPWQWDWQVPTFGHTTDHAIDGERDLIMHDLLKSGLVREWAAVDGQVPPGIGKSLKPDGQYQVSKYTTDGKMYELRLGPAPEPEEEPVAPVPVTNSP